jgi:hypothetical protein
MALVVEGEDVTELYYVNGMIERRIINHCVMRGCVIVVFVSVSDESNLAAPFFLQYRFVNDEVVNEVDWWSNVNG